MQLACTCLPPVVVSATSHTLNVPMHTYAKHTQGHLATSYMLFTLYSSELGNTPSLLCAVITSGRTILHSGRLYDLQHQKVTHDTKQTHYISLLQKKTPAVICIRSCKTWPCLPPSCGLCNITHIKHTQCHLATSDMHVACRRRVHCCKEHGQGFTLVVSRANHQTCSVPCHRCQTI